jgi:hypothetical protein
LARELPLPLTSGDKIYTARLTQALVAAGVSVTFIGLASSAISSPRAAEAFEGGIEWIIVPGQLTKNATEVLTGAVEAEPSVTRCGRLSIDSHLRGSGT